MDKYIVVGRKKLKGIVKVSGAKNVAMKVILTGLLTDKKIIVKNIPFISSVYGTSEIVRSLGVKIKFRKDHTIEIWGDGSGNYQVPLEFGGNFRSATMVLGPLLSRFGKAVVPNPGGCRLGKRPIDRHIDGLSAMGAKIIYKDGFFFAEATRLAGVRYRFPANTHTGTETLILAAVLAKGETILENAAEEPEIDDLIHLLNQMGAKIKRNKNRTIVIKGVARLFGTDYEIMPDRNEIITFAIGAIASAGEVVIRGAQKQFLSSFLNRLDSMGKYWQDVSTDSIRFFLKSPLQASRIVTRPYPGFMTDWQAPWALLMTQATGISTIHETIFEDRFDYVKELLKMGAKIDFFNPVVKNPQKFYNFNYGDRRKENCQAIRVRGKTPLHNAVLKVADLRAGATLVLAALIAQGKSIIQGVEHIDRGYENLEGRLNKLGADIKRIKEKN